MENKRQTLGEFKVRTSFNPSEMTDVSVLKDRAAMFINIVDSLTLSTNRAYTEQETKEFGRLKSLAMTSIEEASMWAVKAATV